MSSRVLILEGLTGTGKTSIVGALQSLTSFVLIGEEETFGDFMTEFREDAGIAAELAHSRLSSVLAKVEATPEALLLERFHFSQIAVGSDPAYYRDLNDRCRRLGCSVVVLRIEPGVLASRSLYRAEYGGDDWQSLIPRYGSKQNALQALDDAQNLRIDAVKRSGLRNRTIDTSAMDWPKYAAQIAAWLGWPARTGASRPH